MEGPKIHRGWRSASGRANKTTVVGLTVFLVALLYWSLEPSSSVKPEYVSVQEDPVTELSPATESLPVIELPAVLPITQHKASTAASELTISQKRTLNVVYYHENIIPRNVFEADFFMQVVLGRLERPVHWVLNRSVLLNDSLNICDLHKSRLGMNDPSVHNIGFLHMGDEYHSDRLDLYERKDVYIIRSV
jgi:hypothetical protein